MSEKTYPQERPSFCPHPTCEFKWRVIDSMCVGQLPEPEPHDGDFNTHRICLNGAADDGGVFDLQINKTDVWWFRRLFDAIFPLEPQSCGLDGCLFPQEVEDHAGHELSVPLCLGE